MAMLLEQIRRKDTLNLGGVENYSIYTTPLSLPKSQIQALKSKFIPEIKAEFQNKRPKGVKYISSEQETRLCLEQNLEQAGCLVEAVNHALDSFLDYLHYEEFNNAGVTLNTPKDFSEIKQSTENPIINIVGDLFGIHKHHFTVNFQQQPYDVYKETNRKSLESHLNWGVELEHTEAPFRNPTLYTTVIVPYKKGEEISTVLAVLRESLRQYIMLKYCRHLVAESHTAQKGYGDQSIRNEQRTNIRQQTWANLHSLVLGLTIDWAHDRRKTDDLGFSLIDLDGIRYRMVMKALRGKIFSLAWAQVIAHNTKYEDPDVLIRRYVDDVKKNFKGE